MLTPESTGVDNTWLFTRVSDEDIRLEFEVFDAGQTTSTSGVFAVGVQAAATVAGQISGGLTLELGGRPVAVAYGQTGLHQLSRNAGVSRVSQVTGRWVIEVIGQTVTIIDPNGKQHNGILAESIAKQATRSAVYVRLYKGASGARLDNFRIFTYEY